MTDGSIAIIGAACRFPGAAGLDAFWELLRSGTDAISEIDARRWSTRRYYHPRHGEPAKSYTWSAGLIDDVDQFEPAFFGISPREAVQMDPQQRIMLELAWHAAEDAGIPPSRLAGSGTGVYIGASSTDYRDLRLDDPAGGDANSMTGGTLSIVANRVSYVFDLRGPSFTVDTACSSSLVALHQACEALRDGRVATAIVGGINLLLAPYPFLGFCRAGMLSTRGRCFAFDERADGYVRGEGGGAVILKPLAQAIADGDRIRGVILATGVNSDGRTVGLSLPSERAQAALIRAVCAEALIAPDDLAFFEMHGTGTPAGDPIEAAAVGGALGRARRDKLPIGSVKSNLGHLEPASAMAGLIKAMLALERGIVPPTLHCETPNPKIPFDDLNLRPVRTAEVIAEGNCAGVNSFGFGGTNGHAILRAPPAAQPPTGVEGGPLPPLIVSARTAASLRELSEHWYETLAATPAERVPALLRAAARRREHHPERLVARGGDPAEIQAAIADFLAGADNPRIATGTAVRDGSVAFVFAGNGAQWPGMGRAALAACPEFRAAVVEADAALRPALGWSVAEAIAESIVPERLARADVAQPMLFAIQVGIVAALRRLGIEAAGHIGHSVGEIAAAWAAGALSLAEAARVVAARSRQQERTRGQGRMAALALGGGAARELIAETGLPLEVGAINASHSVTVSGPQEAIELLGAEARRRGLVFRRLDLEFAFHSAAMDQIRDDLLDDLAGLDSQPPQSLLLSTVTGEPVAAGDLDADYWWRNIRSPVRFHDGMAALVASGFRIFVEIGPHPVLQSYLHDALRAAEGQGRVLTTLTRKEDGADPFPAIAARCHVAGSDFAGAAQFDGPFELSGLPLYPWQRERFWFEPTVEGLHPTAAVFDHPLLGFRRELAMVPSWHNHLDPELLPWLADHAVEGIPVLPAAAVVEMALAAARLRRPDARALEVADVELRRPLPFDNRRMRELQLMVLGDDGDFELRSRPRLGDEPLTLHAVGRIVTAGDGTAQPPPVTTSEPVGPEIEGDSLYRLAARLGLEYGPRFRTVRRIALLGPREAVAELEPAAVGEPLDPYVVHPALLDGALQALLALIAEHQAEIDGVTFLPWRFGRARVAAPYGRAVHRVRLRVTRIGTRSAAADLALYDAEGGLVGTFSDCWFRRVELSRRGSAEDNVLRIEAVPAPLSEEPAPDILARVGRIIADRASAIGGADNENALLLDGLIASVALRTVLPVINRGVPFALDELVESGAVAPQSVGLLRCLLEQLARFGAASPEGGGWRIGATDDLPEIEEVWRLLLAEAPELTAELALVAAAADELPRALADGAGRAKAASLPMHEHLLYGSPVGAAGVELVCDVLGDIAAGWPAGRPLRILELGADGGATRRIVDRVAQSGAALRYQATSPDPEQAVRLRSQIGSLAGAGASCWPPRADVDDLGDSRFDVVVAVFAGARLPVDPAMLSQVRDLLAPGGIVLSLEAEPNSLWQLIFGGTADEMAAPALCSPEAWRSEFAIAGFADIGAARLTGGAWPAALVWGRSDAVQGSASRQPGGTRALMLLRTGDDSAFADALAQAGHRVAIVAPDDFAAAAAEATEAEAVLFAIDDLGGDEHGGLVEATARQVALFGRIAAAAARQQTSLWLVTAGAQQAAKAGPGGLIGAALWGLGRVLANEIPRLELRSIDLDPGIGWAGRARCIDAELRAPTPDTEIVWNATGRHVLRLRRGLPPRWAGPQDAIMLDREPSGGFDALGWRPAAPRPPGPGEVTIDVAATGLNFRDVMWAMGLVPEEALIDGFTGPTFGLECAGVVAEIGAGVDHLAVGDRVAGLAPAALASRVTTAAHAVTRIGPETSFAAAATIPVTFLTAIYALGTLAKVAPGELVLIHAAAGGVGLAAIQYAKSRGAVVIATAGSEVKRAFLRLAGADHVLDSRDLGFADAVRAISGGSGVDVVLNSLSGEAMEQSLGVLKPFGRFLELGKRDFYLNRRVHLRPLRQNISYFAIDVDQLPVQRPDLAKALLEEVAAALQDGAIRPLPHRTFPFAAAGDAFRLMQASGHIGKIVLVPAANAGVRLRQPPRFALRRDGTYLVTGGISGFGFAAAHWLAQHGAGSIALIGRRGAATPGADDRLAELAALGAEARIYAADVADPNALETALAEIRRNGPPLRGVVHAASAIADSFAAELDAAGIATALQAKLGGAVALDRLTRADPIDLFVLFSSATTLLGAPGQGAYVAANLALEALARQRQAQGRPALAIAWGPIEDTGYLAERPEMREALARRLGARPMPADRALAGLAAVAGSGLAAAAFAETSWNEARRFLPILATPLFAELRTESGATPGDDALSERLAGLGAEEALTLLKTVVAEEAAQILRLPAAGIDPARPLSELGMDSLMAVELRLALEGRLRIDLPLMSLAEGTSIASIAVRLAGALGSRPEANQVVSMVERHEQADDRRLTGAIPVANYAASVEVDSAAAE
jgi:acyl transferase domain-containing protein/NADPH:quinone reductase-like Zn-dependent oxidoreductase/acyl carrier protein